MLIRVTAVATAFIALALAGCVKPVPPAAAFSANVVSQGSFSATLCSGGPLSFDCRFAPQATRLDAKRKHLLARAESGSIDHELAQTIQNELNDAHGLLQSSLNACQVDPRTGECGGDDADAETNLAAAVHILNTTQFPQESR